MRNRKSVNHLIEKNNDECAKGQDLPGSHAFVDGEVTEELVDFRSSHVGGAFAVVVEHELANPASVGLFGLEGRAQY